MTRPHFERWMRHRLGLLIGLLSIGLVPRAEAQRPWSVEVDNDALNSGIAGARTDVDYTQGIRLRIPHAIASPLGQRLFRSIPGCGADGGSVPCQDWSLILGQEIYTPLTTRVKPESGDRAYAGWLGASMVTRVHTAGFERELTITLGVTGPLSLAGPSQRSFHRLIGQSAPSGWTAQLGAEPTLDITFAGSADLIRTDAKALLGVRITPVWNASLGTVRRAVEIGVEVAVELGASGVSEWRRSSAVESAPGFYLIGAIRGRVVAGNLFLDGGFFRTGPSVGHLPYVGTLELGLGARAYGLGVEWRVVTSSREYGSQGTAHTYTTLAVTI